MYGQKRNGQNRSRTQTSVTRTKGILCSDGKIQSDDGKKSKRQITPLSFSNIVLIGAMLFFGSMAFALLVSLSGLHPTYYSCFDSIFWALVLVIINCFGLFFFFSYLFIKNCERIIVSKKGLVV